MKGTINTLLIIIVFALSGNAQKYNEDGELEKVEKNNKLVNQKLPESNEIIKISH